MWCRIWSAWRRSECSKNWKKRQRQRVIILYTFCMYSIRDMVSMERVIGAFPMEWCHWMKWLEWSGLNPKKHGLWSGLIHVSQEIGPEIWRLIPVNGTTSWFKARAMLTSRRTMNLREAGELWYGPNRRNKLISQNWWCVWVLWETGHHLCFSVNNTVLYFLLIISLCDCVYRQTLSCQGCLYCILDVYAEI